MTNKARIAFSAAALLTSSAGFATAQDVGANFSDNGTTYTGTGLLGEVFTGFSGAGAFGSINIGPTSIGGGVSLTLQTTQPPSNNGDYFTSRGSFSQTPGGTDAGIYAGALETRPNDTETFTLSGLTAGMLYNVAFYAGNFGNSTNGADAQPISGTVNGTSFMIAGAANDAPAFTANNSAVIDNVVAAGNGTITINTTTSSANYTPFNGVGVEAAPEPSTWVSMLGGAGALAGMQGAPPAARLSRVRLRIEKPARLPGGFSFGAYAGEHFTPSVGVIERMMSHQSILDEATGHRAQIARRQPGHGA